MRSQITKGTGEQCLLVGGFSLEAPEFQDLDAPTKVGVGLHTLPVAVYLSNPTCSGELTYFHVERSMIAKRLFGDQANLGG